MTHDRPHQIKGKVTSAAIVKRVDMTPEHFKIWLRCAEPFPFEPGQYCTVGVDSVERPYSIVSSPREPLLELFVERIPPPEGHLTPLLHALKVGDTVTLRPRAKGVFLLRPEFRNHVMVATVTGVAPFVSMLRYWLEGAADDRRMYVLEGASFHDEFGYDDELQGFGRAPQPSALRADVLAAGRSAQRGVEGANRARAHDRRGLCPRVGVGARRNLHLRLRSPANDRGFARPLRGHGIRVRGRAFLEASLRCRLQRSRGRVPYRAWERHMAVTSTDRTLHCVAVCARGSRDRRLRGGGGDDGGGAPAPPASGWVAGSFLPSASFVGRCVSPRSGTNPANGLPYADIQGSATDENNWLRSWSNELYLWYNEIIDRDPGLYATPRVLRRHLEDLRDDAVRQPQRSLPLHLPDVGLARARAIGHGSGLRRRVVRHCQHAAAADRRGLYASELARDRAGSQPATRRGSVVHRWRRRRQHQHAGHGRYVRCRALSGSAGRESHVRAAQSSDGLAANRDADVRERDDRPGAERQHDQHAHRQRRLHTVQRSPPGGRAAAHRRVRATGAFRTSRISFSTCATTAAVCWRSPARSPT